MKAQRGQIISPEVSSQKQGLFFWSKNQFLWSPPSNGPGVTRPDTYKKWEDNQPVQGKRDLGVPLEILRSLLLLEVTGFNTLRFLDLSRKAKNQTFL